MNSIMYKGNDYSGNLIEKANLYASENMDFIVNRENMEKIELHAGSQNIYGNLGGDFIAGGYKIFNVNFDESTEPSVQIQDFLERVEPKDLYNFSGWSFSKVSNGYVYMQSNWRMFYCINSDYTVEQINSQSGYPWIKVNLSLKPKYIGCALYPYRINDNTYDGIILAFNNLGELLPMDCGYTWGDEHILKENILGGASQFSNDFLTLPRTSLEQQYYQGLTEICTHISSNAYAKIAAGAEPGYYNNGTFYISYTNGTYSNPIVPEENKLYVDIPTNGIYKYENGTYVQQEI